MKPITEVIKALKCPVCGSELYVQFNYGIEQVTSKCRSCDRTIAEVPIGGNLYETAHRLREKLINVCCVQPISPIASYEEVNDFLGV